MSQQRAFWECSWLWILLSPHPYNLQDTLQGLFIYPGFCLRDTGMGVKIFLLGNLRDLLLVPSVIYKLLNCVNYNIPTARGYGKRWKYILHFIMFRMYTDLDTQISLYHTSWKFSVFLLICSLTYLNFKSGTVTNMMDTFIWSFYINRCLPELVLKRCILVLIYNH